jgi:two-component system chemotaxis response regulator CheB
MKKIRVLIIEDSAVIREHLEEIVRGDPRLEVAGSASSAEAGLELLRITSPDVVSLDIRLPGMDGFEATRRIMAEKPTPIAVVSASVENEDLKVSMNALKAGALTIVEKPAGTSRSDYQEMAEELRTQLVLMSGIKVVRQRRSFAAPGVSAETFPTPEAGRSPFSVLGIAASTGGPQALEAVLSGLPLDFPAPILVVQHIAEPFAAGFASWLDGVCSLRVTLARENETALAGNVYIAPSGRHMVLRGGKISLDEGTKVCGQMPSGTVLLESLARERGRSAAGLVLTGMGEDGADGLSALARAGGYAIAQDEASSVVYGMPRAAFLRGGVAEVLPLDKMAGRLVSLFRRRTEVSRRE